MDLKRSPKFLHVYRLPLGVAVATILLYILLAYTQSIDEKNGLMTINNPNESYIDIKATTTAYILPKRALSDLEQIRATVNQEIAFEKAMSQEENTIIDIVPKIDDEYFANIKKTFAYLPSDTQKNFCQKFTTFSSTLTERLAETKETTNKLFSTKENSLVSGRTTREQRMQRNRDLRDTQLNTYFSRLEKNVSASATSSIDSIRNDIINTLEEVRHQTDLISDAFFSGIIKELNTYKSDLNNFFSYSNPKVTQILTDAKKECDKGTSPRIVRLSAQAGLTVVLNKIFEGSIYDNLYPEKQLLFLIKTKNTEQKIQEDTQTDLKGRLTDIVQSIPKK